MITILWDLDGTLVDSMPAIAASFNHVRVHFGLEPLPLEALKPHIGPGLQNALSDILAITDSEVLVQAVHVYRSHYQQAMLTSPVFLGVRQALDEFRAIGAQQFVATAKWQHYAELIVEAADIRSYFSGVYGSGEHGEYSDKRDLLQRLKETEKLKAYATAMIGDTRYDMEAARHHDFAALGVSWGYSDQAKLISAGAHQVVDTPDQLFAAVRATLNTFC